jgi:DNA-binding CsgD family transcriptional regulator
MRKRFPCNDCGNRNTLKCMGCKVLEAWFLKYEPEHSEQHVGDRRNGYVTPSPCDLERKGLTRESMYEEGGRELPWISMANIGCVSPDTRREIPEALLGEILSILTAREGQVVREYLAGEDGLDSVAKKLGKSKSTVKTLWRRALNKITDHFEDNGQPLYGGDGQESLSDEITDLFRQFTPQTKWEHRA